MKIAMIGQKGIPATTGGVERHVEELAKQLFQDGHTVTVYCRSTYSQLRTDEYLGICLKYVKTLKNKNLEAIIYSFKASMQVLFDDDDIIHYHALGPAMSSFIPRLFGKRVIVTIHGLDWQRDKWGKIAKAYLKLAESAAAFFALKLISVSENLRSYFIKKYHKNEKDIIFIPNGVVVHPPINPKEICRLGLDRNGYILFLARIVPEKGAHYLIRAYQMLETDKKLVIAGGVCYTHSYYQHLVNLAQNNPKIIFTGEVQGTFLAELYSNAYLYVLPSDIEGMPITLLEAMSFRKCCLTSDIPENVAVIQSEFGFRFKQGDIKELSKMLSFLLMRPDLVESIGNKAFGEITKKYDWTDIKNQTYAVYQSVLGINRNLFSTRSVNR